MLKRIVLVATLALAPAALAAPPPKAAKPAAAPRPAPSKPAPAKPKSDAQAVTVSADGEYVLGSPKAKVVVTEYGAPTCPYCKQWHDSVYVQLRRDYIDTSKIRFAYRELPSHNPPVDSAIFGIARCAAPASYFAVIDEAFSRQAAIEASNRTPEGPLPLLKALAGDFGVTPDKLMGPCLDGPALKARLGAVQQLAARDNVPGTPTVLIDGVMVPDAAMDDYKALRALLDKAIAAAG
jgi:protein-disulfide isomerase